MKKLSEWMLETIREENNQIVLNAGWLEIDRLNWESLLSRVINHILSGGSVLMCADERYEWFSKYAISNLNGIHSSRPLVPVFPLKEVIQNAPIDDATLIYDLLNLSFKDYLFWYIGRPNTPMGKLALGKNSGFFWIFDESLHMALKLDSKDLMVEYKLIQLYKIFEKALFGVMLGDITLE